MLLAMTAQLQLLMKFLFIIVFTAVLFFAFMIKKSKQIYLQYTDNNSALWSITHDDTAPIFYKLNKITDYGLVITIQFISDDTPKYHVTLWQDMVDEEQWRKLKVYSYLRTKNNNFT